MKFFLILIPLLLGSPSVSQEVQLSCDDYDYLTRDLGTHVEDPKIRAEILIELIKATDPKCFDE